MELVTVIVPIFNVEKYLEKCIDSIRQQTYRNLEIILVNDGSQDNSGSICDRYANLDNRIRVIHKKNGGLSDARNSGIKAANGDYISFIDSDDYIEKETYDILINSIKSNNADMAICGRWIEEELCRRELYTESKEIVMDSTEALKLYFKRRKMDASACDKLFKKELLKDMYFPVGKIHEDIFVMDKIIMKCKKIVHVGKPLYHYVNRKGSITKTSFTEKNLDYIDAHRMAFDRFINNKTLKKYVLSYYFDSYIIIIDKMLSSKLDCEMEKNLVEYRKYVKKNIVRILINPHMIFKRKIKAIMLSYFWTLYLEKYRVECK